MDWRELVLAFVFLGLAVWIIIMRDKKYYKGPPLTWLILSLLAISVLIVTMAFIRSNEEMNYYKLTLPPDKVYSILWQTKTEDEKHFFVVKELYDRDPSRHVILFKSEKGLPEGTKFARAEDNVLVPFDPNNPFGKAAPSAEKQPRPGE